MGAATAIFLATALLYAVSGSFSFVHLWRGDASAGRRATIALGSAVSAHVAYLGLDLVSHGRTPFSDIYQSLAVLSLLTAVGYLLSMRRHRLTVLGAFITPVTLLLHLGAGLRGNVPPVPQPVRSALLPLHVGVNVLGIGAFALAFAAATAYLIQEQLLRSKQVGGMFLRLPALDVLDSMGLRLVTIGFPLFTIGVVTGSVWASRIHGGFGFSTGQGFALLAWVCFGGVLLSRAAAGWRGRRAAIGTMLGFGCAVAALLGYLFRGMGGS